MDWQSSYTAHWKVYRVNRRTWADGQALEKVDGISVSRTADGSLLESGAMSLSGDFESDYYRIVMVAEQGGEITRVDVATLLFNVSGGVANFGTVSNNVNGYSVLLPASFTAVTLGEYAPKGADGALYARDLLQSAINAPVQVEGTFILNEHVVHELGSTVLSAVWSVLDAGNFIIQIDGSGVVHIMPKPTEPSLVLSSDNIGLMMNGINFTSDDSKIPNRYIVLDNNNVVVAENNDPNSIVSTVTRGYNVDIIDESPKPVNGETMAEYANRNLKQLSLLKEEKNYSREYVPDVYPYSIIRASIDGMEGDLTVSSQTLNCNKGITITEKAYKETQLW